MEMNNFYIEGYGLSSEGDEEIIEEQEVLEVQEIYYIEKDHQYYYSDGTPYSPYNTTSVDDFVVERISTESRLEMFPEMKSLRPSRKFTRKMIEIDSCVSSTQFVSRTADQLPHISYDVELTRGKTLGGNQKLPVSKTTGILPSGRGDGEVDAVTVNQQENVSFSLPVHHMSYRSTTNSNGAGFDSDAITCTVCETCFRNTTVLERHKIYHDNPEEEAPTFQLVCPIDDCNIRCDCIQTVVEHVRNTHDRTDLIYEIMLFPDFERYKNWTEEMLECKYENYVQVGRNLSTRGELCRFRCSYSTKAANRKIDVRTRNRDSKKTGRACTAFYNAHFRNDGIVEVRGCFCHIGHTSLPTAVPLSDSIRKEIMQFIDMGVDDKRICDILRENSTPRNRRSFIQPYEIRNIHRKMKKDQALEDKKESEESLEKRSDENGNENEEEDKIDVVETSNTEKTADSKDLEPESVDYEIPPFVGEEEVIDFVNNS